MNTRFNILIAGAGRIGITLANILSLNKNYQIILADITQPNDQDTHANNILFEICDLSNTQNFYKLIKKHGIKAIVSCLPFYLNTKIAHVARESECHYFDVTEDVKTTTEIIELAKDASTAFVPQCGVAPGLVNIIANHLINEYQNTHHQFPDTVNLYCGALPQVRLNTLGYALNWSTDGLINEYINDARVLENSKISRKPGLTDLETLSIHEKQYEAFHTSGGIGTMVDSFEGKIKSMAYKTLRYPGHCEKMKFLLCDLKLKNDKKTIIKILENALPKNTEDFVITHIKVNDLTDTRIFHPTTIENIECSAIQAITSVSTAAVIHTVISDSMNYKGAILQTDFSLDTIFENDLTGYLKNECS